MSAPARHRSSRARILETGRRARVCSRGARPVSRRASFIPIAFILLGTIGCFGARPTLRSYYVLHGVPAAQTAPDAPPFRGLVRVRNLSAEAVYQKFQIVVRRSPYELRYSESNVWAVKPDQMVSDIIARALAETHLFSSVTRELGDMRPDYTMGGELHAIEIYDSNDLWYAHLSLSLTLNRFSTGERLWSFTFDDRKLVPSTSFAHAVRAISELLETALHEGARELSAIAARDTEAARTTPVDPDSSTSTSPAEEGGAGRRASARGAGRRASTRGSPEPPAPPADPAKLADPDREPDGPPGAEEPIYVPEPPPR